MPKTIINAFNAGELSPQLYGRVDFAKYFSGCKTLENFIPTPYGGVERRAGTKYVAATKSNSTAILISFQFSTTQAYILEFGNLYMRVYKDGEQVESGGSPYELVTPFSSTDVSDIRFIQSADTLFTAHPDYPPQKITRTADTAWTIEEIEFLGGPFLEENATDITILPSYPAWADATAYAVDDIVEITGSTSALDAAAVVDKGIGLVGLPATAHSLIAEEQVEISGTTNYDGVYTVEPSTTADEIVIRASYVAETLAGTETYASVAYYKCIAAHTSNADPPPTNTTNWILADTFTGSNLTLTASSSIFDSEHVGALWQLKHFRKDNSLHGVYGEVKESNTISVKGSWDFITHGTWSGTMEIWRSFDNGQNWEDYRYYSGSDDRNVIDSGAEEEDDVIYKVVMSEYTSGSCSWDFTVEQFDYVGVVEITAVNSATEVLVTVQEGSPIGRLIETKRWSEGAWSDYRGYPSCLAFFEERMIYAGSVTKPQTLWMSRTNRFNEYDIGTLDSDPIIYTIAHDEVNAIKWLQSHKELLIGTTGGEWSMGTENRDPVTPTNAKIVIQSTYGSANVDSKVVNNVVLFVTKNNTRLRELVYSFDEDGYISPDLTRLASHLTEEGISDFAYQQSPENIYWAISNGTLLGMSYERAEDVVAWHKHDVGGTVESIAVIEGSDEDELWMIVNRTIDGSTVRYIEQKQPQLFDSSSDCWFVDSGVIELNENSSTTLANTISGVTLADPCVITLGNGGTVDFYDGKFIKISGVTGTSELNGNIYKLVHTGTDYEYSLRDSGDSFDIDSTGWTAYVSGGTFEVVQKVITGLDHLEGEEVVIFADGAVQPNETVSSGSITIDTWATKILVGLGFTSTVVPMELETASLDGGTGQGSKKRINKIYLRFVDSIHCKSGRDADNLNIVYFRTPSDSMNSGISLFSGIKELYFNGDYSRNPDIYVVQDLPLPLTLSSLIVEISTTK